MCKVRIIVEKNFAKKNTIEKEEIKKEILGLVSKEIDQWLNTQTKIEDAHYYEEKIYDSSIEVNKSHPMSRHTFHFGISSKLQELQKKGA